MRAILEDFVLCMLLLVCLWIFELVIEQMHFPEPYRSLVATAHLIGSLVAFMLFIGMFLSDLVEIALEKE